MRRVLVDVGDGDLAAIGTAAFAPTEASAKGFHYRHAGRLAFGTGYTLLYLWLATGVTACYDLDGKRQWMRLGARRWQYGRRGFMPRTKPI